MITRAELCWKNDTNAERSESNCCERRKFARRFFALLRPRFVKTPFDNENREAGVIYKDDREKFRASTKEMKRKSTPPSRIPIWVIAYCSDFGLFRSLWKELTRRNASNDYGDDGCFLYNRRKKEVVHCAKNDLIRIRRRVIRKSDFRFVKCAQSFNEVNRRA